MKIRSHRQLSRALATGAVLGAAALALAATPDSRPVPSAAVQSPAPAAAPSPSPASAPTPAKPLIEVAFVLDTTGSMGGLIEGAKTKIWSIANELVSAKPSPEIRIGLVAYRDRGDSYVTQVHDLSADLDAVYGQLRSLVADGGGDGPESVNQALAAAVHQLSWSTDRKALKLVFLVGDAPPHMDYPQDTPYARTVEEAVKKDIVVDTVQCGADGETARVWQEIARRGEGKFVALGASGDMVAVSTPLDGEIATLSRELGATAIGYGADARREEVAAKVSVAAAAPAAVAADKATFAARGGAAGAVVTGEGDLVADVAAGKIAVGDVKPAELPEELRALAPEQRAERVKAQVARRADLERQVNELVRKRDELVVAERKKLEASGAKDSFDGQVARTVREQAAEKGFSYDAAP